MWLNQLFTETSIDFEKRCRARLFIGIIFAVIGVFTFLLPFIVRIPVLYLEPGYRDSVTHFYTGIGVGLLAGGLVAIFRNLRYLKNPELKKTREIYETDERNRALGLRCWAYAGYSMFLALYIGVLISGFISLTAMKILLTVAAVFALLLLVFRRLLQSQM